MASTTNLITEKFIDKFNVVIVGNKGVGKTSIVKKLVKKEDSGDDNDSTNMKSFNPSNYYEKAFKFEETMYYFKIWEAPSKERDFTRFYLPLLRKADCIVMVCASNDRKSFEAINQWSSTIKGYIDTTKKLYLISNKTDLDEETEIGVDEIKQKCEELKIKFFETSARSGYGVEKAFNYIFKKVISKFYKGAKEDPSIEEHFEVEQKKAETTGFCQKCLSSCIII